MKREAPIVQQIYTRHETGVQRAVGFLVGFALALLIAFPAIVCAGWGS